MFMPVHRNNPGEYHFKENCFIIEWWNSSSDSSVSIARVRVEPGVTTKFHSLEGTCERYIIIDGEGLVEIGSEKAAAVSKGDVAVISPGERQRITNTGKNDLIFLAVCTPRFVPENYRDCENETNSSWRKREIPTLVTARLVLRPFNLSDAPLLQRLAGDFSIADTTAAIPHPYPDGAAETWINTHKEEFACNRMLALAVTIKETGVLAGCVSIMNIDSMSSSGEIGYWIGKDFWGRGYCTEAASAIMKYGFEEIDLNRIQGKHLVRNPASGRVMQKLGMKKEGYLRQTFVKWGRYEDCVLYAILRDDRAQSRQPIKVS
jgi:RimJ/RimL family protein N-acetyltransferase/mannose-6-phosphate isomerase-like protein (cupin superfamily)